MTFINSLARQAVEAHQAGHVTKAEKLYRAVLAREPDNGAALHLLGVLLHQSGRTKAALRPLEKAATLLPLDPEIRNNFGVSLNALGSFADAAAQLEQAVELDVSVPSAFCNLGVAYQGLRRLDEARAAFEHAIALKAHPHVHSNLGLVHLDRGDAEMAAACFEQAIAGDPAWAQAHVHLGLAQQRLAQLPAAIASFDTALLLDPAHGQALSQRCQLRQSLCDWRGLAADRAALSSKTGAWRKSDPPSPFTVLALTDDPEVQLRRARDYAGSFAQDRRPVPPWKLGEKIRIAYLSPDFRRHPVAALMADILAFHDRARFEVFAFSYGPDDGSELRKRIVAAADHFLNVAGWADTEVATYLRTKRIDIAVDLAGFTTLSRPVILAGHPASIQVNYLGYPGTTGADWIDYTIGDAFLAEPDVLRTFLSESMVMLPGSFQANSRRPDLAGSCPSRTSQDLPEEGFVFCAFSNSHKLTPELFAVWLRLLLAVPGSVLWLLGDDDTTQANLKREAQAAAVAPDRLVFAQRVAYEDYLARLPLADLFLDTFPYNAGTTAADALWMGVPLLTLSGRAYASRMAGSLLTSLNLAEFVTTDLPSYEERALRLAKDPALLARARDALAFPSRSDRDLFNPAAFTRKLDKAFIAMIERKTRGLKAANIEIYAS